jgi:hypothetical protein
MLLLVGGERGCHAASRVPPDAGRLREQPQNPSPIIHRHPKCHKNSYDLMSAAACVSQGTAESCRRARMPVVASLVEAGFLQVEHVFGVVEEGGGVGAVGPHRFGSQVSALWCGRRAPGAGGHGERWKREVCRGYEVPWRSGMPVAASRVSRAGALTATVEGRRPSVPVVGDGPGRAGAGGGALAQPGSAADGGLWPRRLVPAGVRASISLSGEAT